ncbi:hypothetical protein COOONC_23418, partial [Cooperia oncophora]
MLYPGPTEDLKDKLSELKKSFAKNFITFQTKLLKTEEPKHHKVPLINGEADEETVRRINDPVLHNIVIDVLEGVQAIRQEMLVQEH